MNKGKAVYNTLIRSVLRIPFEKREERHAAEDASVLGEGRIGSAMNTLIYSGPLREELAFFRALNSALAEGILPDGAMLSLTMPSGYRESALKASMEAFGRTAEQEKVHILGGHTSFSENISVPVFTVSISGVFSGKYGTGESAAVSPGQSLILTKYPGDTGAMILYEERKEFLSGSFSAEFLSVVTDNREQLSVSREAEILRRHNAFMHDVSEGGILGSLWAVSEGSGLGFTVDFGGIPMHQETVEIAEALSLNPYTMYTSGCMLASVNDPEAVLEELYDAGIPAVRIGEVRADRKKLLLHDDEERYLDRPSPDACLCLENFG